MNCEAAAPFASIESAQEYLRLLTQMVLESQEIVAEDIRTQPELISSRQRDALNLIVYKLEKLRGNLERSNRALNDLRTLRRLIQRERTQMAA
ncbi:MAG TPA: hypothetical protein VFA68_00360 [Terriglobales bacterium]|nr:hypothetical protein [Terriglobales bacterium]